MLPLVLLLIGCGLLGDGETGGGPPPAPVVVAEVGSGLLDAEQTFLGEVRPVERAELSAGATGQIVRVAAREGDAVRRGEVLLEVDPSLAIAAVRAAEAALDEGIAARDEAATQLERLERVDGGVVAPTDLDQARTRLAAAEARVASLKAALDRARAELGRHRVVAPFDGVLARRRVDRGDWVSPGVAVLDLVSAEQVEVLVALPADLVRSVHRGDPVGLVGYADATAEIAGVVPALDPQTRTALVRVVPAPGAGLVPGSSVQVRFTVDAGAGVLVPRDALVTGPTGSRVVEVVDGKAHPVPVQVLASTREVVLVSGEGLEPGDVVVVRGNERLRPGQPVQVAE